MQDGFRDKFHMFSILSTMGLKKSSSFKLERETKIELDERYQVDVNKIYITTYVYGRDKRVRLNLKHLLHSYCEAERDKIYFCMSKTFNDRQKSIQHRESNKYHFVFIIRELQAYRFTKHLW